MDSFSTFLQMGGHGGFVWPAYGITALVLVILFFVTLRGMRGREAELRTLQELRRGSRAAAKEEAIRDA